MESKPDRFWASLLRIAIWLIPRLWIETTVFRQQEVCMEKQMLTEVTPPGEETEKTEKELIQEIVEATSELHNLDYAK
jgi:hypothetical protein